MWRFGKYVILGGKNCNSRVKSLSMLVNKKKKKKKKKKTVHQQVMEERDSRARCPMKQLNFRKHLSKYQSLQKELMDIKQYNAYYVKIVLKKDIRYDYTRR